VITEDDAGRVKDIARSFSPELRSSIPPPAVYEETGAAPAARKRKAGDARPGDRCAHRRCFTAERRPPGRREGTTQRL